MVKIGTILSRKWSKEPSWLAMCSVYIRNELPTGLPARFNAIQHKGDILPIRTCGDFYVSFVHRYCHEQSTCRIVPWLFPQSIILTIDNSTFDWIRWTESPAFWMVGLNKVVCDCVLWRSGSHCWYAGNWKSCNVCRIFSVKAIFETRESRPKFISSTREQNFQKCPALKGCEFEPCHIVCIASLGKGFSQLLNLTQVKMESCLDYLCNIKFNY